MNQPNKTKNLFFFYQTFKKLSTCYSFSCVWVLLLFLIETLCMCVGRITIHPSNDIRTNKKTMKKKYKKYLARMKERHQQQQQQHTSLTLREFLFSFIFARSFSSGDQPTNQKLNAKKNCPLLYHPSIYGCCWWCYSPCFLLAFNVRFRRKHCVCVYGVSWN